MITRTKLNNWYEEGKKLKINKEINYFDTPNQERENGVSAHKIICALVGPVEENKTDKEIKNKLNDEK